MGTAGLSRRGPKRRVPSSEQGGQTPVAGRAGSRSASSWRPPLSLHHQGPASPELGFGGGFLTHVLTLPGPWEPEVVLLGGQTEAGRAQGRLGAGDVPRGLMSWFNFMSLIQLTVLMFHFPDFSSKKYVLGCNCP